MPNLNLPPFSPNSKRGLDQRGQIIIEYILLLVVALGLAVMIMKTVVSRDKDSPGFLFKRWQGLIDQVAKDDPNKRGP